MGRSDHGEGKLTVFRETLQRPQNKSLYQCAITDIASRLDNQCAEVGNAAEVSWQASASSPGLRHFAGGQLGEQIGAEACGAAGLGRQHRRPPLGRDAVTPAPL